MNTYTPDKWVVVKIEGKDVHLTYKVFACWYGGYLNGDSWKMNSGIKKVRKMKKYWLFDGLSGSIYECHKERYGTNMYGGGVLEDIIKRSKEADVNVEVMNENTNWLDLVLEASNIEE